MDSIDRSGSYASTLRVARFSQCRRVVATVDAAAITTLAKRALTVAWFALASTVASAQTSPVVSVLSPLSPLPVGASFAGSFSVTDPAGGSITKLRVHVSTVFNGSDCAVDVGTYSGTQAAGTKVFSGCAELSKRPGIYHLKVEAWNSGGVQAPVARITVQVGPVASATALSQAASVSIGENTACGVDAAGAVRCWGGFVGGDLENTVAVAGLAPVMKVSVGAAFACALERSGAVKCWGDNANGQLGNGSTTASATPVQVTGLPAMAQIAAGRQFACGLTASTVFGGGGAVYCWGWNFYGQLGALSPAQSTVPVLVAGLSTGIGQISTGAYHGCALLREGGVRCWGFAHYVDGNTTVSGGLPAPVTPTLGAPVMLLAANGEDTCGITTVRTIACWGQGSSALPSDLPTQLGGLAHGAMRADHCTISVGGNVLCQGSNETGQVGNGRIDLGAGGAYLGEPRFQAVVGLRSGTVTQLAQGPYGSCAVTTTGLMYCWGYQTRITVPSVQYVYATTAYEVPAYRSSTIVLAAPTILSANVQGSDVTLAIADNLVAGSPSLTTMQTKCRQTNGTLSWGAVSTFAPSGRNPSLRFTLLDTGPWTCAVRSIGTVADGTWGTNAGAQSPWSNEFAVTNQPSNWPSIQSAKYNGTTATIVFTDNSPSSSGPILSKNWYCFSASAPPGTTSSGFIYATVYSVEPTATTHTLQFALPAASDWQCRVGYATYGGNSPLGGMLPPGTTTGNPVNMVPLASVLPGTPIITSGRVAATSGLLNFSDGQAPGVSGFNTLVTCTNLSNGGTGYGGSYASADAFGGMHSVSFQAGTSNYLQDPSSYSCTLRVQRGVLTSASSAAFTIMPNQPPTVNGLNARVVDGRIVGEFVIADADGDRVKNMIVRFGNQPGGSLCSSGYLVAPEVLVSSGVRSFQVQNESCAQVLAQETTIYAWVELYDEFGRQAPIVSVAFDNIPSPTVVIPDPLVNQIVFEGVPSDLSVDQPTDITLRMVDASANTVTGFVGSAQVSVDADDVPWSMQDEVADVHSSARTVRFYRGVARLKALRFHAPGNVSLTATVVGQAGVVNTAGLSNDANMVKSAPSTALGLFSSKSPQMAVSTIGQGGPPGFKVSLALLAYGSAEVADLGAAGAVRLYLVRVGTPATEYQLFVASPAIQTFGTTYGTIQGVLMQNFAVPNGEYNIRAKRNGLLIQSWNSSGATVKVQSREATPKISTASWANDPTGKKAVLLVHGVFGSTMKGGGAAEAGAAPRMPFDTCSDSCVGLEFYKSPIPFFNFGWSTLADQLRSNGYYVVEAVYDWRLKPATSAQSLARHVSTAIAATGVPRVDIYAHSMGGLVATSYMASLPASGNVVDRLVFVGTPFAGSVNAYYLMALGSPWLADTKVGFSASSFSGGYTALARQLFADKRDPLYTSIGTHAGVYTSPAKRIEALAKYAPGGWSLYPRSDTFSSNGGVTVSGLSQHRKNQISVAGATPTLANGECISVSAASSRTNAPSSSDKTRLFYLVGNDSSQPTLVRVGPEDRTTTTSASNTKGNGDGTVPFGLGTNSSTGYSQVQEFKRVAQIASSTSVIGTCVFADSYGPHPFMPGNTNTLVMAAKILRLGAVAAASAAAEASSKSSVSVAALQVPTLVFTFRGDRSFSLTGAFGSVGADTAGSVTTSSGGAEYSQISGLSYAFVTNPVDGAYSMQLGAANSTTRVLTTVSVSYSPSSGATSLQRDFSFFSKNSPETLNFSLLGSAPSVSITGRPQPVPKVRYSSVGGISSVSWVALADPTVTGYNAYARRSSEEEWKLVATAPAAATSIVVAVPPASNDVPEYRLAILAINAQGESPVGDIDSNRLDTDPALDFGDGVTVPPGTMATSAPAFAYNQVAQPFTIQGGQFSINSGAWSSSGGTLKPGDLISVRGTAPATPGQTTTVSVSTNTETASFAVKAFIQSCFLDIDGDGSYVAAKDGVLLTRYLLGFRGAALIGGLTLTGLRTTAELIEPFIASGDYDFDGDSQQLGFVDGLIGLRVLQGIPDASLLTGITLTGSPPPTAPQVRAILNQKCVTTF